LVALMKKELIIRTENLAQSVHSGKIETDLHTSWKIRNCIITTRYRRTKFPLLVHFAHNQPCAAQAIGGNDS